LDGRIREGAAYCHGESVRLGAGLLPRIEEIVLKSSLQDVVTVTVSDGPTDATGNILRRSFGPPSSVTFEPRDRQAHLAFFGRQKA
jgi:hypothetical protein